MTPKPQSAEIRRFIIRNVGEHPADIAKVTCVEFGVTRQATGRHLAAMVKEGLLDADGNTRSRRYSLATRKIISTFPLDRHRDEDRVWREMAEPFLLSLPDNVSRICHYGFTEMFNNVIDHSGGTLAHVELILNARTVEMRILDDGVGVFEKIKQTLGLEDHRQAIFALSKGKLTTDPERHSGQGIFFTSRMFDEFTLTSGGLHLRHSVTAGDWLIQIDSQHTSGTFVTMEIATDTARSTKEIFDQYSDTDKDDGFTKTCIPLILAKYGRDVLVSRSQAKRVLAGIEDFGEILLDFKGVDNIGQAFADEIFRVFQKNHPRTTFIPVNANLEVTRMIARAVAAGVGGET